MAHKTIALTTELRELLGVIFGCGLQCCTAWQFSDRKSAPQFRVPRVGQSTKGPSEGVASPGPTNARKPAALPGGPRDVLATFRVNSSTWAFGGTPPTTSPNLPFLRVVPEDLWSQGSNKSVRLCRAVRCCMPCHRHAGLSWPLTLESKSRWSSGYDGSPTRGRLRVRAPGWH